MSEVTLPAIGTPSARPAPKGLTGRLIHEKPLGAFGGAVFLLFLVCGVFAEIIAPYGLNETNMAARLLPPSAEHLFGT
ncbi:MAG: ABC transporter permease, partial [Gammaproteobacteria bacterium]|nr:ABC transporter permease [Gammaproteobacteria bacterium]